MTLLRAAPLGCLLLGSACGGELERVPVGPLPVEGVELGVVEYPPPPAKVERIPEQPEPECAWLDGHWEFRARRWRWVDGDWVLPPAGCHYVEPFIRWLPSGGPEHGTLYALEGLWVREDGSKCALAKSCTGRPSGGERRDRRGRGQREPETNAESAPREQR